MRRTLLAIMLLPALKLAATETPSVTATRTESVTRTVTLTRSPTPTSSPTPTATMVPTASCAGGVTAGNSTVLGATATGNSNYIFFMPLTAPSSGQVSTVRAYVNVAGGGAARGALYNGVASPGSLLGESGSQALINGWNTFNLGSAVLVTGGTNYWVAVMYANDATSVNRATTPGNCWFRAYSYANFPAAAAASLAGNTWTGFAEICPIVSPTPTATVTPTQTSTDVQSPTETRTLTPTPTFTDVQSLTSTKTLTPTPTFTDVQSATSTGTVTPTPTFTDVQSRTHTHTVSPTPTYTDTQSPTGTPSITFSVTGTSTQSPTETATCTLTPTVSPSQSVTMTFTMTLSATETATPNISASPSPSDTATGTISPSPSASPTAAGTLTPAPIPIAALSLAACLPVPNPNPDGFRFLLTGRATDLRVRVYSVGLSLVSEKALQGNFGPGWVTLGTPLDLANGIYYFRAWAQEGTQRSNEIKGKLLFVR